MQIYAIIGDDKGRYLVARNRYLNSWWSRNNAGSSSIVNQPGQYSLPGGKKGQKEFAYETANRVYREQTGLDPADLYKIQFQKGFSHRDGFFEVWEVYVSADELVQIRHQANLYLQPDKTNSEKPVGHYIKDWVLDHLEIFKKDLLPRHLGTLQPPVARKIPEMQMKARQTGNKQDVAWYRMVAEYYRMPLARVDSP